MPTSLLLLILALTTAAPSLTAQARPAAPVRYEIAFPNRVHHEGEVTIRFAAVPAGPLRVEMARSSPGRYALHEFAKNVTRIQATDPAGRALTVTRLSPHAWAITGHRGEVQLRYTLFADRADGTYAGIDETKAHLNIPATFAYAPALAARPIEVTFRRPDPAWAIATQLQPTTDAETFRAPNLAYFLDSPTHLGALEVRRWEAGPEGRTQQIQLAVNHEGTRAEVDSFATLTRKVVDEMAAVFGELPRFDFGSYTFIACYRATCAGDGMEHRNSTSLTSSSALRTNMLGLLGTVSHEFFHAWNVERIRPRSLEPFDFSKANMSGELWFAEGFTNYYGVLTIARAGIVSPAEYARRLTGAVNAMTVSPARGFGGAVAMSQQAPFVDAAVSIDPQNRANTFLSYYTYGEALGLALDLTLRARPAPVTLDDLMRWMWMRFGREQSAALAPVRTYTVADAQTALAEVTRDPAFARDFFARYVVGSERPAYETLLARAGFLVRPARPGQAWLGDVRFTEQAGGLVLGSVPLIGSPLYEAGLTAGDRIARIEEAPVLTTTALRDLLATRRPGTPLRLTWIGRTGERTASVTLAEDPNVEVVAFEEGGRAPTAAQLAFRAAWVGSRIR
ncbi:MAG: M61 family metallopeptidase [Gemmatimonadaceae bacterium]|jgi:predicted metalloprotease with PDZ domain